MSTELMQFAQEQEKIQEQESNAQTLEDKKCEAKEIKCEDMFAFLEEQERKQKSKKKKTKRIPFCYHCFKQGHFSSQCRNRSHKKR